MTLSFLKTLFFKWFADKSLFNRLDKNILIKDDKLDKVQETEKWKKTAEILMKKDWLLAFAKQWCPQ